MANTLKTFTTSIKGKSQVAYDYKDTISPHGDFQKIEGINVLINSVRNLLLTPLGSYPFNPNYGSLLYKKVFEPLDDQALEDIQFEVKDRVQMFDGRVTIESVKVQKLSDNKGVSVTVKIRKGNESANVKLDFNQSSNFGLEEGS